MKQTFVILFFVFCSIILQAQTPTAIGQWKSYLPYGNTTSAAAGSEKVYAANGVSVFAITKSDNAYQTYSKSNGLSDVGVMQVFYGETQKTAVLSYLNSNVDFIVQEQIINFPYIKNSQISGDKSVNHAAFAGDTVLLSCGFGIVLYSISKNESPATFFFTDTATNTNFEVYAATIFNNAIYAATEKGVFKGAIDETNLQDFSKWENVSEAFDELPDGAATFIEGSVGDRLFVAVNDSLVFVYDGTSWVSVFSDADGYTVQHMSSGGDHVSILRTKIESENILSQITTINSDGNITFDENTSAIFIDPRQVALDITTSAETSPGSFWVADPYKGLVQYKDGNIEVFIPNGPASSKVFDLAFYDHTLWVAPGEIDLSWQYLYNYDGFFKNSYGIWSNINAYTNAELSEVYDMFNVFYDPVANKAYFGSYGDGLVEYDNTNGSLTVYNQYNTEALEYTVGDTTKCRIAGIQTDAEGNLWITNYGALSPLVVRTALGEWIKLSTDAPGAAFAQIIIDDFNQKWIQCPRGCGIYVYNHGEDLMSEADDQLRLLGTGAGNGNLATKVIYCLAKDKDGEIWVGTSEGISIFYNPSEIFSGTTSGDASQPLVNLGGYNEYLLSKEQVNCITVDGANRKWVGTNSGVFLINEDGTEQLLFFNEDNSPLLSNFVLSIAIDELSGEVFFGTSKGIISFRYTATEGAAEHSAVKVFPNPVRENYNGVIAISGLVENAQVKITDDAGRLIYETTALGGQAIWDGKGYDGRRANTGVYLVYSSNDDGSQTYVTKFLIVH
jgi:hypothetical protein